MKFSIGKYRNDSLKISVKAVLTRSFINGFKNGKPGCHTLLIRKSAAVSILISTKLLLIIKLENLKPKCKLPAIFRPLNKSDIFNCKLPKRSISTRTFSKPPGPPTLVTVVVCLNAKILCIQTHSKLTKY